MVVSAHEWLSITNLIFQAFVVTKSTFSGIFKIELSPQFSPAVSQQVHVLERLLLSQTFKLIDVEKRKS